MGGSVSMGKNVFRALSTMDRNNLFLIESLCKLVGHFTHPSVEDRSTSRASGQPTHHGRGHSQLTITKKIHIVIASICRPNGYSCELAVYFGYTKFTLCAGA